MHTSQDCEIWVMVLSRNVLTKFANATKMIPSIYNYTGIHTVRAR